MTKRSTTAAETSRNWLVTANRVDVSGLITFAGLYSTGHRLVSGLPMTRGVPPIIAMPADKELTTENVVAFVNERRRAYGEKQIGRAYTMSDVTIYQEDTIIALLNEKNIGLADSTAKRARKPRTDDDDTGLGIAGLLDMEDGEIAADEEEPPRLPDNQGGSAAGDAAANEDNAVLMDLVKNALKQIAALEKRVRIIECSSEGTVQIKTHDDIITMYCFYQKDDNEDFLQRCKRLLRTFDLDDVADSLMSAERLKTGDGKLYASAMSELKFRSPEMATKLIENKGQFAVSTQNDEQKRDLLERLKKLRPRGGRDIDFAFKTERVFSKKTKPETKPAPAGLELF